MSRKSKVENSPHHEEIHQLLLKGKSSRWIAKYLEEEYNEVIGYWAIYSYQKGTSILKTRPLKRLTRENATRKKQKLQ